MKPKTRRVRVAPGRLVIPPLRSVSGPGRKYRRFTDADGELEVPDDRFTRRSIANGDFLEVQLNTSAPPAVTAARPRKETPK